MERLNVVLLFGGQSTEHEVSCASATNVLKKLNRDKYNVIKIGITQKGQWYLFEGDESKIKDGSWEKEVTKTAVISPDTSAGIIVLDGNKAEILDVDVVFPVLHGVNGEDGTVQGLCALAKIPCVGPRMLHSGICMDKDIAKVLFERIGVNQAQWVTLFTYEIEGDIDVAADKVEAKFSYPVFVKPANAGSSVGIGKSHNREELKRHLKEAILVDEKVIVEEFINGRELECAVLGNLSPVASFPGEVIPKAEFYSYDAKYVDASETVIPAKIDKETGEKIKNTAIKVFKEIGLKGLSRIDFFLHKETGEIYLNEINTLPGFTDISMYPMLMQTCGFEGESLIDKLIELAIEDMCGVYNG